LILHICCAPDATVAYERFAVNWEIFGLFFNPNIEPFQEYDHREAETRNLSALCNVEYIEGSRDQTSWLEAISSYENEPEGGERCRRCIAHRLEWTARYTAEKDANSFTTTLTVSPHKDINFIHKTGIELAERYGVKYIAETLRKRDGFLRSLELSRKYKLYRQNYCGCRWSLNRVSNSIPKGDKHE